MDQNKEPKNLLVSPPLIYRATNVESNPDGGEDHYGYADEVHY